MVHDQIKMQDCPADMATQYTLLKPADMTDNIQSQFLQIHSPIYSLTRG